MQHSKSQGSFRSGDTALITRQRPRTRSSLDTFVIPGRTRIPSSKPEAIDIQIAETLLNPVMEKPTREWRDELSSAERKKNAEAQRLLSSFSIHVSQNFMASKQQPALDQERQYSTSSLLVEDSGCPYKLESQPHTLHKVRPEISQHPPPQIGGRNIAIIPPRRSRKVGVNPILKRLGPAPPRKVTPPMNQARAVYDGAIGSSYESRTTSMTWSTISHRILTNSSESSQCLQAPESLQEFNRLATQHGLPEMQKCPDDEFTKLTEKTHHHHNWLTRKLFHRSSSTYTLKVKSSHKALRHKKSFGIIPKLEHPTEKNIFKERSLEEICRLGGMGVLALPEEFGLTKQLSMPTSLSATATYLLQHGTNNPGIFRVSGQQSTVTALYEYYAFQFAQAGSPSKVQETVGSGLLPAHIEHTVPDIASLFKKILNALPGGLLGSLELFEAFRSIFFRLPPDLELSESATKTLQAKLIALAISSVTSTKRISLIQAVIGLVAYFGNEAETARKATVTNTNDVGEEIQPPSELMGFQALGVVMGPLMLGALTDQIDPVMLPDNEDMARKSFDSGLQGDRKSEKKRKRTSLSNKLDRDATLSTHVDRANLTANVMELLLIIWRDVVVQLRELQVAGSSTSLRDAGMHERGTGSGAGSRQHLANSDEESFFVKMIRGRPSRAEFSGEFKVKKKVRIARSARARGVRRPASTSLGSPATVTSSEELSDNAGRPLPIDTAPSNGTVRLVKMSNSSTAGSFASDCPEPVNGIDEGQRTRSEVAMAQMSMGTILPRLHNSPSTPLQRGMLRCVSEPQTPKTKPQTSKIDRSSSGAPQTALRDLPKPDDFSHRLRERSHSFLDKPLPTVGPAQRAELIQTGRNGITDVLVDTTHEFPARKSSLSVDKATKPQPFQLAPRNLSEPGASTKAHDRSSATANLREITQPESNVTTSAGRIDSMEPSKKSSVRVLAQHFDDGLEAKSSAGSMESDVPKVYAKIYALPPPKRLHRHDPFFSFSDVSSVKSPDKLSRIPKPAQDVGKVRKRKSCSSSPSRSPPKSPKYFRTSQQQLTPTRSLRKCPSDLPLVRSSEATLPEENSNRKPDTTKSITHPTTLAVDPSAITNVDHDDEESQPTEPRHNQKAIDQTTATFPFQSPPPPPQRIASTASHRKTNSSLYLDVAPTRPLSAYSVESLRRMHLVDEPPVAQHIPTRAISVAVDVSDPLKAGEKASDIKSGSLKRSGSVNTTMAAEIYHLKRLLEQKEKDVKETRRSLDALRDSREDVGSLNTGTAGGGMGIGTLANELRIAKKETAQWKKRAEWAEGRLAVIDQKRKADAEESTKPVDTAASQEVHSGGGKPIDFLHD